MSESSIALRWQLWILPLHMIVVPLEEFAYVRRAGQCVMDRLGA